MKALQNAFKKAVIAKPMKTFKKTPKLMRAAKAYKAKKPKTYTYGGA